MCLTGSSEWPHADARPWSFVTPVMRPSTVEALRPLLVPNDELGSDALTSLAYCRKLRVQANVVVHDVRMTTSLAEAPRFNRLTSGPMTQSYSSEACSRTGSTQSGSHSKSRSTNSSRLGPD